MVEHSLRSAAAQLETLNIVVASTVEAKNMIARLPLSEKEAAPSFSGASLRVQKR